MMQISNAIKNKNIMFVIMVFCVLIVSLLLYPSLRYETASIGKSEIRYDRLNGIIYLKSPSVTDGNWTPTGYRDIMELKYYLAEKELEQALEETRKYMAHKRRDRVAFNKVIVIPASQ